MSTADHASERKTEQGIEEAERGNPEGSRRVKEVEKENPEAAEAVEQVATDGAKGRGLAR